MKKFENRQFGRRTTHIRGLINIEGKRPVPCLIRNVSQGGALLEVDAAVRIPTYFQLVVEMHGFMADCEQRHRTKHGVGVFFQHVKVAKDGSDLRFSPEAVEMPKWSERSGFRIV